MTKAVEGSWTMELPVPPSRLGIACRHFSFPAKSSLIKRILLGLSTSECHLLTYCGFEPESILFQTSEIDIY